MCGLHGWRTPPSAREIGRQEQTAALCGPVTPCAGASTSLGAPAELGATSPNPRADHPPLARPHLDGPRPHVQTAGHRELHVAFQGRTVTHVRLHPAPSGPAPPVTGDRIARGRGHRFSAASFSFLLPAPLLCRPFHRTPRALVPCRPQQGGTAAPVVTG